MKKTKSVIVCLILALTLCMTSFVGFARSMDVFAETDPPIEVKAGACLLPNTESLVVDAFMKCIDIINQKGHYDIKLMQSSTYDAQTQANQIETFIDNGCRILFIIPIDYDLIYDLVWRASEEGIFVFIYGDEYKGYPNNIIYLLQLYYDLGVNHALSIINEQKYNHPSYIYEYYQVYVAYYNNKIGLKYIEGFKETMDTEGNGYFQIHEIIVDDEYEGWKEIDKLVDSHFLEGTLIDEIVSCITGVPPRAYNDFISYGYVDDLDHVGIGIRAFGDIDNVKEYVDKLAEQLAGAIEAALSGSSYPNNFRIYEAEGIVIDCGFPVGYAKYVKKEREDYK